MDVPSPVAGTVTGLSVALGDNVSAGTLIRSPSTRPRRIRAAAEPQAQHTAACGLRRRRQHRLRHRAGRRRVERCGQPRQWGRRVTCTPRCSCSAPGPAATRPRSGRPTWARGGARRFRGPLGGVCLNIGCIPSKALLHAAKVIAETKEMSAHGLSFAAPTIDLDALRAWKDGVVPGSPAGWAGWPSSARSPPSSAPAVASPNMLEVTGPEGRPNVSFDAAIIAAGSEPVQLPFVPHDDARVIDSTGALELDDIPERLLVLGGGIIGLEMATVYAELGLAYQRGGADGPADPRRGQGHRQPARQAHRPSSTRRSGSGTKVTAVRRARTGSPCPSTRRTRPPPRPRCSTRCSSRSAAAPTAS